MSFNKHALDFNSYWYNFLFTSIEQDYFYYIYSQGTDVTVE